MMIIITEVLRFVDPFQPKSSTDARGFLFHLISML
jgi:hypothetical protein